MAAYNYLPGSFQSALIRSRVAPGGVYDRLGKSFTNMGEAAFANADFNVHFFKHNFGESWSSNYSYRDVDTFEFTANIFGEIVGEGHGTLLGAQGNHFPGPNTDSPFQITDQTRVKNTLMLACPTDATPDLNDLFHDQIVSAVRMRDADVPEEIRDKANVDAREFVKAIRGNGEYDAIMLTSEPLYTTSQRESTASVSAANSSPASTPRREYKKRRIEEIVDTNEAVSSPPAVVVDIPPTKPSGRQIYVGALYDRQLMPDYGGSIFAQQSARLVQHDWRDENNDLIAPWEYYNKLRPGTVIVANVSFHVYVLSPKATGNPTRKFYHAVIHSLKVIARSDIPVELPVPYSPGSRQLNNSSKTRRSKAAAAFEAITSEQKDIRRDQRSSTESGGDGNDDHVMLDASQPQTRNRVRKIAELANAQPTN